MWDPHVYLTFADQRARPFYELLSRIFVDRPRRVVDLGCGPGNLTAQLARRWPDAVIEALDSSPQMVAAARERGVDATVGDLRDWEPRSDTDVVLSNAAVQWVPEHAELLVRWAGQLTAGAWIGVQMPGAFDAPTYLHQLTGEHPVLDWISGTALLPVRARLDDAAWQQFRQDLVPLLADVYPARPDGTTLYPFRQVFVVAQVGRSS
ncbi:methyltransferase domain-containing protein [Mycobacterium sp.]|uniref:methyltransferase domain-containing protein n=1 Tax=Mycobacterium sp. TaxID=1785 RepID=UPI00127AF93F|nr:methyltransferase domain-containing protein [Mycobacterium sp.]KAA8969628.1 MAG: methyltransferase domain-containing protein [Mycobacterium sp.]